MRLWNQCYAVAVVAAVTDDAVVVIAAVCFDVAAVVPRTPKPSN